MKISYARQSKLVLTTFLKMKLNGLNLCEKGVDLVVTFQSLFMNLMDGFDREWFCNVVELPSCPAIQETDLQSTEDEMNILQTELAYFERIKDVIWRVVLSGVNMMYMCTQTESVVARSSRSYADPTRPHDVLTASFI